MRGRSKRHDGGAPRGGGVRARGVRVRVRERATALDRLCDVAAARSFVCFSLFLIYLDHTVAQILWLQESITNHHFRYSTPP